MRHRARLLFVALACAACDPRGLGEPMPDFRVIGHRGAPLTMPENTLESFEVAVAVGANAIETDVCITEDRVFVLWHDADPEDPVALARQSGAEGLPFPPDVPEIGTTWRRPVHQLTLEELRTHYGYTDDGGNRMETSEIPTVAEMLDWARGEDRIEHIYFDVKLAEGHDEAAAEFVREMVEAWSDGTLDHVTPIFLSPHRDVVVAMEEARRKAEADWFRVAWDHEGPDALRHTRSLGLREISVGLTPQYTWSDFKHDVDGMVEARERGDIEAVTVWTFDRDMQLAELLYYSVDGIMTNDPALVHRMWQDSLR